MPIIAQCLHCLYFANSTYMVCGVNPNGPLAANCDDFVACAKAEAKKPLGGGYYTGDWIPHPFPHATLDRLDDNSGSHSEQI
jgi:hypothetical protein